jgi:peptidoglycan/LPS O-acetylase OafA/YrhL
MGYDSTVRGSVAAASEPVPETGASHVSGGRLALLDAFRAIAVLLVLGRHILDLQHGIPPALGAVLRPWNRFGWIGVDFFFVLSGFLVSGLLFQEYRRYGRVRPFWFLGRRGFKIYPGFYFLLFATWLWKGGAIPTRYYLSESLFLQNYLEFIWNHTWSLAIEEHFYLALTFSLWALVRFRPPPDPFRALPRAGSAILVLVLALRFVTFSIHPHGNLLYPTHLRLDALLFGTLIAYGWSFHRDALAAWVRRFRASITVISFVLLVPCLLLPVEDNFVVNTVGLTTNYLGFGGLVLLAIVAAEQPSPRRTRILRPLAAVGFYSYSIYLWHMPMYILTHALLPQLVGAPASIAAYLAGSLVMGWLTARVIELPFLRLRDRLLPSRAALPVVA